MEVYHSIRYDDIRSHVHGLRARWRESGTENHRPMDSVALFKKYMSGEKRMFTTEKLVVPIAAVVAAFVFITPAIMWASNLTTRMNIQDQVITDLKTRLQHDEDTASRDSTRTAVLEANYAMVLSTLSEIKQSLEKIETRFNLR